MKEVKDMKVSRLVESFMSLILFTSFRYQG